MGVVVVLNLPNLSARTSSGKYFSTCVMSTLLDMTDYRCIVVTMTECV